ncbi:MAG: hypothetical protein IJR59_04500, partial [Firmicutes bacterium]|nr:hypothetical protein [Bacillota bacterium]
GSVWTFNDALRYFRIAQMKHESTGKYGFGEDTEQIRKKLPYYTVYTGESGKSVNIYGTGAIMVKTVDGKFEVPAQHGANIEYTAFNAVIPWADGINTVSAPTKKEYNSGDTLDLTGMKIVYSKNGNVTEITDWDGLEAAGLHLYVLDTKNWQKTFTKLTKNTRIGAPYADSSGKENYIILCSETDTIYYTTYQYNYNNFIILDTDGINVTQGSYDTEFVDNQGYYMIYSKSDLDAFIAQIKPGNPDTQKARLYADIEFTADKIDKNYRNANWTTLSRFSGVFDGNGHSISGICVTGSKKCSIFGDLYGKVINLTIKNSCFTDTVTLTYFGGGIADHVESSGLIENCTLGSDVYVNGGHAGGFAGSLDGGKISKCSSDAVITALSDGNAGGICGVIQYGTIENCRFGGTLSCTDSAGGIVSCVNHNSGDSYVKNCYSIGNISSNTAKAIATVSDSGSNTASVTNCYYLSGNGTDANAAELSSTQFASGEAAYLLNTNGDNVWYQNIDITPKDAYPVLDKSHGVVIKKASGYGNDTSVTVETTTETTTQAAVSYDSNGFGSDGSYQQPSYTNSAYQISNAGQLYWYAAYINNGSKANAVLTKDITVNGGKMTASSTGARAWTPIAAATEHSEGVFFTNSFDGKG